jgi:hypothetical protein
MNKNVAPQKLSDLSGKSLLPEMIDQVVRDSRILIYKSYSVLCAYDNRLT